MKTLIARFVLPATLLSLSVTASAGESATLRYNSAELGTTFHASRLYQRIERTAENHCTVPGRRSLDRMIVEERCVTEVVDRMIRKIDSRVLSAIHEDRLNGRKVASL